VLLDLRDRRCLVVGGGPVVEEVVFHLRAHIRVSTGEEIEGLDLGEHGISAYPEFHTAAAYGTASGVPVAPATARIGVPAAERSR
jgi:hypothetical protein